MDKLDCSGSCLCGAIRYHVTGKVVRFTLCHCGRCRKASGSEHTSNIMLAEAQVEWKCGEDLLRRYKVPEAEHYLSTFCGHCGSPLPRCIPEIGMIAIPAGSLDENPGISPQADIFWDSRAKWLEPGTERTKYEAYPPGV